MAERDNPTLLVSRQAILVVTALGVGLLTLCYVLGVQVGKQSAALRKPEDKTLDEQLRELPEPLVEQLKVFEAAEAAGMEKVQKVPAKEDAKKVEESPKAEADSEVPKGGEKAPEGLWTLQLVTTPDEAEVKRIQEKAKAAGYATKVLKDKGQMKVRLAKPVSRADADAAASKLKEKGLKPFAVKVE